MLELAYERTPSKLLLEKLQEYLADDRVLSLSDVASILKIASAEALQYALALEVKMITVKEIDDSFFAVNLPSSSALVLASDPAAQKQQANRELAEREITELDGHINSLDETVMRKRDEVVALDELIEKWESVAVDIFTEISCLSPQRIAMEDMVVMAGFDPDDLNIDYDVANGSGYNGDGYQSSVENEPRSSLDFDVPTSSRPFYEEL